MMKNIILIAFIIQTSFLNAQNIPTVSAGKCQIVFSRAKILGPFQQFTYFDGDKVIGQYYGQKYTIYECDPGKHVLWAKYSNASFVEANLIAGKRYVIDVIPKMGGVVKLVPVDKNNYNMKKMKKLFTKYRPETYDVALLDDLQEKYSDVIDKGLTKYEKMKSKGKKIPQLKPEMWMKKKDLINKKR
jgi:hypothetical protein